MEIKIGKEYGDMVVLKEVSTLSNGKRYLVECLKCGRTKEMRKSSIDRCVGITHKACSQGYRKNYPKMYSTWAGMVNRTTNPNDKRYSDYGGKGINHEFELFIDFVDYMLESFIEHVKENGEENTTLERIDNSKGYIKGNIRWATYREQATNRSTTVCFKAISPDGIVHMSNNAQEFAEMHGLDRSCISKCIRGERKSHNGWKFEKLAEMCVETTKSVSE